MNKNKIKRLFAMAVISGTLIIGLHNTAYAVITDYAIKVEDDVYCYNREQLEQSFLNYKSGESSKLYEDFKLKLANSKGFYAFKDDKKGYVPYESIQNGFLKSKDNNEFFNIDKFVETEKYDVIDIKSVKEISVDNKEDVVVKESELKKDEKKDEVSLTSSKCSSHSKRSKSGRKEKKVGKQEVGKEDKKKEEVKPVVVEKQEVGKEEKKQEVGKEDKKKEEVKPVAVEKQEVGKEEKKKESVKPAAIEKHEIEKQQEKKIVSSVEGDFEASIKESSRRHVEKAVKPVPVVSKTKGNLSINSEVTQTSQKSYRASYQETTILVQGTATKDITLEVAGKKVEIKKGDSYGRVVDKIYNRFKGDENWDVRHKYGQWGRMGNITFRSKEFRNHIDISLQGGNGLTFKIKNEDFGEVAIGERKETCTAKILNDSTNDENIKVEVKSSVMKKTFATIELQIKKGETKEKIAERIVKQLKINEMIKRCFKVENKGEQVIVVQNEPMILNLSVTVE